MEKAGGDSAFLCRPNASAICHSGKCRMVDARWERSDANRAGAALQHGHYDDVAGVADIGAQGIY